MESESPQLPLKVCPHCSVASRTDADTCPSCGEPYGRRRRLRLPALRSPWWIGAAIILAAFGVSYGGTKLLRDDDSDESGQITFAQGAAVFSELRQPNQGSEITRAELVERLGTEPALTDEQGKGAQRETCLLYAISDQEGRVWQFCFQDDTLSRVTPSP